MISKTKSLVEDYKLLLNNVPALVTVTDEFHLLQLQVFFSSSGGDSYG